ncbi:MAG TPA: tetratricopeptide repeat protein, partial [Bryobacteraceae bacterium]|nr:tetratricopeptide repeat protein [Bryobacteraceae bacterium]
MLGVCLLVLLLLSSSACFAANVSGEVQCDQCNNFTGMHVELSGTDRAVQPALRVPLSPYGGFSVSNIAKGDYIVSIRDSTGTVVGREFVRISEVTAPLAVRVEPPTSSSAASADSQTVSVKRLTHKPPRAARKAFEHAMRKVEDNDTVAAIPLLEKAVELDPQYVEALNNLGARYIMVGRFDPAIRVLIKAIEVDPHSVHPYSNLSLALMATGDAEGAERAARQALEADPGERRARYLLGMSLFSQRKITPETIDILRQTQEFPRAQVALAMAEAAT